MIISISRLFVGLFLLISLMGCSPDVAQDQPAKEVPSEQLPPEPLSEAA